MARLKLVFLGSKICSITELLAITSAFLLSELSGGPTPRSFKCCIEVINTLGMVMNGDVIYAEWLVDVKQNC